MKFSTTTVNAYFISLMMLSLSSSSLAMTSFSQENKNNDQSIASSLSLSSSSSSSSSSTNVSRRLRGGGGRVVAGPSPSKKGKRGRNFIDYVIKETEQILEYACDAAETPSEEEIVDPVWSMVCEKGNELLETGARFESTLPSYIWANYRVMTLAYPFVIGLVTVPEEYAPFFYRIIRLHRALGYGNNARMIGFGSGIGVDEIDDDIIDDLYWSHFHILKVEDDNVPSVGPGIDRYCNHINGEYEMLKQYGRDNFDSETDLPSTTLFDATNLMYAFCIGDSPGGYIARSDWNHHRSEFLGSMMTTDEKSKAFVLYTIFHWESLFVLTIPDNGVALSYEMLDESMQKLVDYVESNNGVW